jgi:hypothetical protein
MSLLQFPVVVDDTDERIKWTNAIATTIPFNVTNIQHDFLPGTQHCNYKSTIQSEMSFQFEGKVAKL